VRSLPRALVRNTLLQAVSCTAAPGGLSAWSVINDTCLLCTYEQLKVEDALMAT